MQAYMRTSQPLERNKMPSLQLSTSVSQPNPALQAGYYVAQQQISQQWNASPPVGLIRGDSFHSFSQPNSSAANLQSTPVNRNELPGPALQPAYYGPQQNMPVQWSGPQSHGLSNEHTVNLSSQSSNLIHYLPTTLTRTPLNVTVQCQEVPSSFRFPSGSVNLNHPQSSQTNAAHQDSYHNLKSTSVPHPLVNSSGSSVLKNNQMSASVLPTYQNFNKQHNNIMQMMHQSVAQVQQMVQNTQVSHSGHTVDNQVRAVMSGAAASVPPPYNGQHVLLKRGQTHHVNVVQNSSLNQGQPPLCITQNSHVSPTQFTHMVPMGQSSPFIPQPVLYRAQQNVQSRLEQNQHQSLPQHNLQPQVLEKVQTRRIVQECNTSGNSSKIPSVTKHQGYMKQQDVQNNTANILTKTSLDASLTSPISEAPLHDFSRDTYQHHLLQLLLDNNGKVQSHNSSPPASSSNSSSRAQIAETTRSLQTTANYTVSPSGHSQMQASVPSCGVLPNTNIREIQNTRARPSNDSRISVDGRGRHLKAGHHLKASRHRKVDGSQFNRPMESRKRQSSDETFREVEHCTDPVTCLELAVELLRAERQFFKAVAVVPPISQKTNLDPTDPSPVQKEDVFPSTDDDLTSKVDAVKAPEEITEMETSPQSPFKDMMELCKLHSVEHPQEQENITAWNDSSESCKMPANEKTKASDQPDTGSKSQSPVCPADLIAKSQVHQNDDLNVESSSDDSVFDLSTVPVIDYTLDKLQCLVKSLEATCADKGMETMNLVKQVIDLYWDGDGANLSKATEWLNNFPFELVINKKNAVVFQYIEPENFKRLACHCILENGTTLTTEEVRSSWWNAGKLADIDLVLAEPLSNYGLTLCEDTAQSKCDTVNPPSPVQVAENVPDIVDLTKVQEEQSNRSMELENEDYRHTSVNVISSHSQTSEPNHFDKQQVLIDDEQTCTELPISPVDVSSSDQHVHSDASGCERGDISDADSNDSLKIDIVVLSSDDATTIFKRFGMQKESTQLCQDQLSVSQTNNKPVEAEVQSHTLSRTIRFTCPHLTDVNVDGSHFCTKCWADTPLLDVNLDESPVTPKDGPSVTSSPHKSGVESCSPQPVEQAKLLVPEVVTRSVQITRNFDCFEITGTPSKPKQEESIEKSRPLKPGDPSCIPKSVTQTKEQIKPVFPDDGRKTELVLLTSDGSAYEILRAFSKFVDQRERSSSQSVQLQVHETLGPVCLESTKPVAEEICEVESSSKAEAHLASTRKDNEDRVKPIPQSQTESSTLGVSSSRHPPYNKLKRKRLKRAATLDEDVLFSPDAVIKKKPDSHKEHSAIHRLSSHGYKQSSKDERKKRRCSPVIIRTNKDTTHDEAYRIIKKTSVLHQESSGIESVQPERLMPTVTNRPECSTLSDSDKSQQKGHGGIKQDGQKKLLLFGCQNNDRPFQHQCHDGHKCSSAPAYITISSDTSAGRSYTDSLSAKQKVYSNWESSFVLKHTSSHKSQKKNKSGLKDRIKIVKRLVMERVAAISAKEMAKKKEFCNTNTNS